MEANPTVREKTGADFFVPRADAVPEIDRDALFRLCSACEFPVGGRAGAAVRFSVLDGVPQTAEYSAGGVVFARAVFDGGRLSVRSVDADGDGVFETTELFGYDPENETGRTADEIARLDGLLFGGAPYGRGVYMRMLQIDGDGDTVPDFTEEYLARGGKISSWDSDGDGNWNVRYIRHPQENDGLPLKEEAQFYRQPENTLVTVVSGGGRPVRVEEGGISRPVTQGESVSFYWIGGAGTPENEALVLERTGADFPQGVSAVIEDAAVRISAVKIGGNIFARILSEMSGRDSLPEQDSVSEQDSPPGQNSPAAEDDAPARNEAP